MPSIAGVRAERFRVEVDVLWRTVSKLIARMRDRRRASPVAAGREAETRRKVSRRILDFAPIDQIEKTSSGRPDVQAFLEGAMCSGAFTAAEKLQARSSWCRIAARISGSSSASNQGLRFCQPTLRHDG